MGIIILIINCLLAVNLNSMAGQITITKFPYFKSINQKLIKLQFNLQSLKNKVYNHINNVEYIYQKIQNKRYHKIDKILFKNLKGNLPWPTKGLIIKHYGQKRIGNRLWQGIYIATQPDAIVTATHSGKIMFANWLKGFGLLMIIKHLNGYMTLYGNNSILLKKTGELVHAGEPISITGFKNTGYSLYFEIRKNGQTINPEQWLSKS